MRNGFEIKEQTESTIFWFGKARGRRIVNYATEEQRSKIEKESGQFVTLFQNRSFA